MTLIDKYNYDIQVKLDNFEKYVRAKDFQDLQPDMNY